MSEAPATPPAVESQALSSDARRAILQRSINWYIARGYRVVSQTDSTAQMLKPKSFSLLWSLLCLACFGIGIVFYMMFWWLVLKDQTVYIEIDALGQARYNGVLPPEPRQAEASSAVPTKTLSEQLNETSWGANLVEAWNRGTGDRIALVTGGLIVLSLCPLSCFILAAASSMPAR